MTVILNLVTQADNEGQAIGDGRTTIVSQIMQ